MKKLFVLLALLISISANAQTKKNLWAGRTPAQGRSFLSLPSDSIISLDYGGTGPFLSGDSLLYLRSNGTLPPSWQAVSAGGMSLNGAITGGSSHPGDLLFINGAGNLAADDALVWDFNNFILQTPNFAVSNGSVNINAVQYEFPVSQGASSTFLKNDGSGNLTWTAPSTTFPLTGGSTSGVVNGGFYGVSEPSGANLIADPTDTNNGKPVVILPAGTMVAIRLTVDVAPTGTKIDSIVVTKNGVLTTYGVSLTGSAHSALDNTHTLTVADGDRVAIKAILIGSPSAPHYSWYIMYRPN